MAAVDMGDLMLEAAADVQAVMMELTKELGEQEMVKQTRKLWSSLPDDMKTRFAQERPAEYEAMKNLLKGE